MRPVEISGHQASSPLSLPERSRLQDLIQSTIRNRPGHNNSLISARDNSDNNKLWLIEIKESDNLPDLEASRFSVLSIQCARAVA
jgi:hypothetical protein